MQADGNNTNWHEVSITENIQNYDCSIRNKSPEPIEEVMLEIDEIKVETCYSSEDVSDDNDTSEDIEVPLVTIADSRSGLDKQLRESIDNNDGCSPQHLRTRLSREYGNKGVTGQPREDVSKQNINTKKNRKRFNNSEVKHKIATRSEKHNNETKKRKNSNFASNINHFSCGLCNYSSRWRSSFSRHIRTHTGEKPYACSICSYRSNQKSHLSQHLKTHTDEKPFACNICSFKFNRKSNLTQHIKKHTGEKPISCNLCPYKCYHESDLKRHVRIHTGEKPFACNICSYRCNQKGHLKEHIRTHR